jgi:hypothetical protein
LGFRKLALTFVNSPSGFRRRRWRLRRQWTLNIAAFERGTLSTNTSQYAFAQPEFNVDAEAERDLLPEY